MMKPQIIIIFFFHLIIADHPLAAAAVYAVTNYGANPDGKTDATSALSRAWNLACTSRVPATIYVPEGNFAVKKALTFNGPCKSRVTFQIKGTLLAPSNYLILRASPYWIEILNVDNLSVYGGTLNGRGAKYWACKMSGKNCPTASMLISIRYSSNIMVSGLTIMNSQGDHMFISHCTNVQIRDVKIRAPSWSPNTDGIHILGSTGITVTSSSMKTGDDCISFGPGAKNIWVEGITCGPGHGISIGSLGGTANEDGVQNVTVKAVVFTGTMNGARIKTWAYPYSGFVKSVLFENIIMRNVSNPIVIDQKYCPSNSHCPAQSSGVKISGVTYKNIKGTSNTQVAMNFVCSTSNPCRGIKLQNINLNYYNNKLSTTSHCEKAYGSGSGVIVPKSCLSK